MPSTIDVRHLPDKHRFEAEVDGEVARAEYRQSGSVMTMTHTIVPQAIEGRGVAARMIEVAFEHARAHGLKIEPQCAYVAAYMKKHPETEALRA